MFASIMILVIINGCGSGINGQNPDEGFNYRTGTKGITLNFPVDSITKVYENDPDVRMIAEIKNEGAFPQFNDIGKLNGFLWVGGFDNAILDLRPEERRLDERALEGKSPYNQRGGYSAAVIRGPVYSLPKGTQSYKPKLKVTATYDYETLATALACIDPAPRSTDVKEKVCDYRNFRSLATGGSQGAPVAVTSMEEEVAHDNILFKMFIKNVGGGLIIDENDVDKDPNLGYDWDTLNRVHISDINVGNRRMTECRPDVGEFVDLVDGEGFIFCRFSTSGVNSVYTSPINVKLDYSYANSIEKELQIFEEVEY